MYCKISRFPNCRTVVLLCFINAFTFIWSCTSIWYTRVGSYLYSSTWQHALVVYQVLQLFLANAGKKERMADLEQTRFLLAQNLAGSFVICQTQIHILELNSGWIKLSHFVLECSSKKLIQMSKSCLQIGRGIYFFEGRSIIDGDNINRSLFNKTHKIKIIQIILMNNHKVNTFKICI